MQSPLQSLRSQHEIELAKQRELQDVCRQLLQLPAYRYLKFIALTLVVKPYECNPPVTAAEQTRWDNYNTVRWAFERFFSLIERTAGTKPPIEDLNADYGRPDHDDTSTADATSV